MLKSGSPMRSSESFRRRWPRYLECRGWIRKETLCGRSSVAFDLNQPLALGNGFIGAMRGSVQLQMMPIIVGSVAASSDKRQWFPPPTERRPLEHHRLHGTILSFSSICICMGTRAAPHVISVPRVNKPSVTINKRQVG